MAIVTRNPLQPSPIQNAEGEIAPRFPAFQGNDTVGSGEQTVAGTILFARAPSLGLKVSLLKGKAASAEQIMKGEANITSLAAKALGVKEMAVAWGASYDLQRKFGDNLKNFADAPGRVSLQVKTAPNEGAPRVNLVRAAVGALASATGRDGVAETLLWRDRQINTTMGLFARATKSKAVDNAISQTVSAQIPLKAARTFTNGYANSLIGDLKSYRIPNPVSAVQRGLAAAGPVAIKNLAPQEQLGIDAFKWEVKSGPGKGVGGAVGLSKTLDFNSRQSSLSLSYKIKAPLAMIPVPPHVKAVLKGAGSEIEFSTAVRTGVVNFKDGSAGIALGTKLYYVGGAQGALVNAAGQILDIAKSNRGSSEDPKTLKKMGGLVPRNKPNDPGGLGLMMKDLGSAMLRPLRTFGVVASTDGGIRLALGDGGIPAKIATASMDRRDGKGPLVGPIPSDRDAEALLALRDAGIIDESGKIDVSRFVGIGQDDLGRLSASEQRSLLEGAASLMVDQGEKLTDMTPAEVMTGAVIDVDAVEFAKNAPLDDLEAEGRALSESDSEERLDPALAVAASRQRLRPEMRRGAL